jgi:hypothetical protein
MDMYRTSTSILDFTLGKAGSVGLFRRLKIRQPPRCRSVLLLPEMDLGSSSTQQQQACVSVKIPQAGLPEIIALLRRSSVLFLKLLSLFLDQQILLISSSSAEHS